MYKEERDAIYRQLKERSYVYVINPEFSKPRLYRLTEKGKKIVQLL